METASMNKSTTPTPVWEANFGTLASVANRWPIGLAHQHSGFSFAFPGQNAPPIAVWGGRTAENSRVLHRHSNWHSCPHRHNSAPLSSCAPVHALIGNVCTGASAHRVRFVFRFMAWPGMFRTSGSQASRLSHALLNLGGRASQVAKRLRGFVPL